MYDATIAFDNGGVGVSAGIYGTLYGVF